MNRINVFVCENFAPEYYALAKKPGLEEIRIHPFPCMCEDKGNKARVQKLLDKNSENRSRTVIVCSKYCDILQLVSPGSVEKIVTEENCFNYISNTRLLEYIVSKGGYVIGSGWLKEWRRHIENMGFDRKTAIAFYHDTCDELVYFDTGADETANEELNALSEFLELPFIAIPSENERLEIVLKHIVSEAKCQTQIEKNNKALMDEYAKTAEYAAILDIMGRITACKTEREAVESIKNLFIQIMGATEFKFYKLNEAGSPVAGIIEKLIETSEFGLLIKEENKFYIEIKQRDELHGYIEAGGFIVPESIEKYYSFAANISNVIALILTNIRVHEDLVSHKEKLKHLSYHDGLTGLYNRTYLNHVIKKGEIQAPIVFSMDIDGLKYVNDTFGHLEGDKLIVSVSDIFKKCFRKKDLVARIGGDEFVAIINGAEENTAEYLMERIKSEIEKINLHVEEDRLKISISIGYTMPSDKYEDIDTLMKIADEKMYENKRSKKA